MERPSGVVELDGQVGDPAGRDVLGHVDLAAPHDAEADDAGAGRRVEAGVERAELGVLQRLHEGALRPLLVDPAQELPDVAEVLDVVDQRGAGQGHHQRTGRALPDPVGELEDVLGALRGLVLDEVRLVDDHAAEAEVAQPADVAVQHLVVDDHDVGEAVEVLAVAVDDRHRVARRPQLGLARPVGLDHVGHHAQQRVGAGGLGRQQRLGGLAQAGLVGQQEGAVAVLGRGHDLGLVRHQLQARGRADRTGLGQVHARRGAALLEGAQQRADQLPAGQPAGARGAALLGHGEVGRQERVGQLTGDHRLRDHPALGRRRALARLGLGLGLRRRLHPGGQQHLPLEPLGGVGDRGVLGQQRQQGGVAGGGLGQDRGDAVEPLHLGGPVGLGGLGVGLDPGPLLAGQQRDHLELRAQRLGGRSALHPGLDLAHGAREHRQDAFVVQLARRALTLGGAGGAGLTLTSSSQEQLLVNAPDGSGSARAAGRPGLDRGAVRRRTR